MAMEEVRQAVNMGFSKRRASLLLAELLSIIIMSLPWHQPASFSFQQRQFGKTCCASIILSNQVDFVYEVGFNDGGRLK